MRLLVVILVAISLVSCKRTEDSLKTQNQFNIDSLLGYHISILENNAASLSKISNINQKVTSVELGKVNWVKEFETFKILNLLNKLSFAGRFKSQIEQDSKSNLIVRSWIALSDQENIQSLKVYYLKESSQIKRVEASLHQNNFIFKSKRKISMEFEILGTKPTINEYQIIGEQNFFWEAPNNYSIKAVVRLK